MGRALNKTGRPIWYQYGSPYTWSRHGTWGCQSTLPSLFSLFSLLSARSFSLSLSFCLLDAGGAYGGLQWITQNYSNGGVNSYRSGFDMGDSWGLVGEQVTVGRSVGQ